MKRSTIIAVIKQVKAICAEQQIDTRELDSINAVLVHDTMSRNLPEEASPYKALVETDLNQYAINALSAEMDLIGQAYRGVDYDKLPEWLRRIADVITKELKNDRA